MLTFLLLNESEKLPAPRTYEELLVYITAGSIPLLFGWLANRQKKNREDIKRLKSEVGLNKVEADERHEARRR